MGNLNKIICIVGICIIFIVSKYMFILYQYKEITDIGEYSNWTMTQRPFYNTHYKTKFLIDDSNKLHLNLWWESLTGSIDIKVIDEDGDIQFRKKEKNIESQYDIPLEKGKYTLSIEVSNFTGSVALGYKNLVMIHNLPNENYRIIKSKPQNGFYWDYILYIPNNLKNNKLLVVPNNTGKSSDNIEVHIEKAKECIMYKSELAEQLGVPLLVPIFPRPNNNDEMYTQALDRESIFTNIEELKRLDLQLISMIDDSRDILSKRGIVVDKKILMSGFSASGDFVDRFTFLHPEIVSAAVIGGSDNIIPYSNLNQENIPYPIGIYDYEKITGKKFDINLIAEVNRYIYKGSEDEGGWQVCEEDGETTIYTGKQYFEKFELPMLNKNLENKKFPIYVDGNLSNMELKEILFRAYKSKILIDKFLETKEIFDNLGIDKSEFVIYEGLGHEINKDIESDELDFFNRIIND